MELRKRLFDFTQVDILQFTSSLVSRFLLACLVGISSSQIFYLRIDCLERDQQTYRCIQAPDQQS
ncbi:hypothetical protein CCP2SC5_1170002 [Azospirillaceae bacterium]